VTLLPGCRLDGTVVLADAETVRARAADRYVGDTIARQLAGADLVALNKRDLVPARELPALERWTSECSPGARIVCTERAQLPAELVLGGALPHTRGGAVGGLLSGHLRSVAAAQTAFESAAFAVCDTLDLDALAAALTSPALGVLRAKGILRDRDGSWQALHVVGARHELSLARAEPEHAGLVCIGLAGRLDAAAIREALARCSLRAAAS
jgi:G3E family GTPase